jgi:hypothetical protein
MKYLCLIYGSEGAWANISREDGDRIMGEYFAFTDDIKHSGQLLGGEALPPTATATVGG